MKEIHHRGESPMGGVVKCEYYKLYYLPHFPLAEHFFAPSHLPAWHLDADASFPVVHPVKATSANPTNELKINFFISVSCYFILTSGSIRCRTRNVCVVCCILHLKYTKRQYDTINV